MRCPECFGVVKALETVHTPENEILRRRKCDDCGHQLYTVEFEVEVTPSFLFKYSDCYRLTKDSRNGRIRKEFLKGRKKNAED